MFFFRKFLRNCEGCAYFLSASGLAKKIMSWRREVPVSSIVLFDVFTVLGVYLVSR